MRAIHKYLIEQAWVGDGAIFINRPAGPIVLVEADGAGFGCIWAEVDTDDPPYLHPIYVIGTGQPVPPNTQHEGSYVTAGGLVWHVYSEIELVCTECWRAMLDPAAPADCWTHHHTPGDP